MIATIGSIYKDARDLLPHFYKHYNAWGVDRFYWGIYGGESNPLWEWVKSQSAGLDVVMMKSGEDEVNVLIDQHFKNQTRQLLQENDWYIPVDMDEFHMFEMYKSFPEAVNACEKEGAEYAPSHFVDHIAKDGNIPPSIDPNISIWEQFPVTKDISRNIVQGLCTKVCLAKSHVIMKSGHHYPEDNNYRTFSKWGRTHHFKWFGNLREREKRKLLAYVNQDRTYLCEPARLLEYLNLHNNNLL